MYLPQQIPPQRPPGNGAHMQRGPAVLLGNIPMHGIPGHMANYYAATRASKPSQYEPQCRGICCPSLGLDLPPIGMNLPPLLVPKIGLPFSNADIGSAFNQPPFGACRA